MSDSGDSGQLHGELGTPLWGWGATGAFYHRRGYKGQEQRPPAAQLPLSRLSPIQGCQIKCSTTNEVLVPVCPKTHMRRA